jgi:hypothetical protein
MRIYDQHDDEGRVIAFEISSLLISRSGVCAVAETVPGALVIERPRPFTWTADDDFCQFEVDGQRFKAWEPFGDNSRYWIGPVPTKWCPQTQVVRAAFAAHTPVIGSVQRFFGRASREI